MATVLPPVLSARSPTEGYPAPELKCKLSKLRQIQVDTARNEVDRQLELLRQAHVRNEEQRQDALVKEQNRLRRHEIRQQRMKLKLFYVTKMQALVRSFLVRKHILPTFIEAKETKELFNSRAALADTMLGLHRNIHDLAHLDKDRRQSATRIQAWWRGVLANRVVAIITLRHHLVKVGARLGKAATRIAAYARGRQARMGCFRLRLEKEKRMQLAREAHEQRMIRAIVKVQSHVRRRLAIRNVQVRRQLSQKGREGEGAANDTIKMVSIKSPEKGDRSRRRRKSPPSGQGHGITKHRTAIWGDEVECFETGGMMVRENHDLDMRKTKSAMVQRSCSKAFGDDEHSHGHGHVRHKLKKSGTHAAGMKRMKTHTFEVKRRERESIS